MNDEVKVEGKKKLNKFLHLNRHTKTMIILLVIVSIGGITLYFANGKGGFRESVLLKRAVEPTSLSLDSENGYHVPRDENIESAYSILSPSNQEQLSSIPGLVTGQSELSGRISSISTSIESLTNSLADFKAEMDTTLYSKFQALDQQSINSVDIQSQLTLLNKNFKGVKESVAILKKQITNKTKTVLKTVKKNKSTPPFKLVSVQVWNSKPVAIVSHLKTSIGVGVNDVLAGWTIDSILIPGCMEVSQQNRSVKLCL
jgi:hypothetical protein